MGAFGEDWFSNDSNLDYLYTFCHGIAKMISLDFAQGAKIDVVIDDLLSINPRAFTDFGDAVEVLDTLGEDGKLDAKRVSKLSVFNPAEVAVIKANLKNSKLLESYLASVLEVCVTDKVNLDGIKSKTLEYLSAVAKEVSFQTTLQEMGIGKLNRAKLTTKWPQGGNASFGLIAIKDAFGAKGGAILSRTSPLSDLASQKLINQLSHKIDDLEKVKLLTFFSMKFGLTVADVVDVTIGVIEAACVELSHYNLINWVSQKQRKNILIKEYISSIDYLFSQMNAKDIKKFVVARKKLLKVYGHLKSIGLQSAEFNFVELLNEYFNVQDKSNVAKIKIENFNLNQAIKPVDTQSAKNKEDVVFKV